MSLKNDYARHLEIDDAVEELASKFTSLELVKLIMYLNDFKFDPDMTEKLFDYFMDEMIKKEITNEGFEETTKEFTIDGR